ncbi:MAG: M23 family metallopeptidase [Smithellaceae bacterium]|jgi:murein DD-endopeptidase MepM/ murein hydrolase activator NlpD
MLKWQSFKSILKDKMSGNLFTLMVIPRTNSAVKKISLPGILVSSFFVVSFVAILIALYFIYDYASIKRDRAELVRLRGINKEQSQQVQDLALRVDEFSDRMEELRQVDKKLRILAIHQTGRDKKLPLGIGGAANTETRLQELLDKDQQKLILGMRKNITALNEDANYREKSFNELLAFLHEQKSILAATPSIWPVKGWVTSDFGPRASPFSSGVEFHKGLDIATRFGKEVLATADGLVIDASFHTQDGNLVKIDHGHGLVTAYAHLSRIAVKYGVRIKRGDVIGYVGDTGRSTGSHLHYAVFVNKVPVNPRKYLKNKF